MTLQEAKEKLAIESEVATRTGRRDLHKALKLGIEALKEYQNARVGKQVYDGDLLPGETEE